jgi:hypothetical protein
LYTGMSTERHMAAGLSGVSARGITASVGGGCGDLVVGVRECIADPECAHDIWAAGDRRPRRLATRAPSRALIHHQRHNPAEAAPLRVNVS